MFSLFVSLVTFAQTNGEMKIATSTAVGQDFEFRVTRTDDASKVFVDWGDGNKQEATLEGWSSNKKVTGKLLKDTIVVYGDFSAVEVSEAKATYLAFKDQPNLKQIEAKRNELTYEGIDLSGVPNLVTLDLSYNKITRLDLRNFKKLSNFTANHNELLATVLFPNGSTELTNIDLSDGDITHFYPVSLPNLRYLNLANGSLLELELGNNYPELRDVDITGNVGVTSIDVTQQAKLEKLLIKGTKITELNLINNPELIMLDVSNTNIAKLDLSSNKNITTLELSDSKLSRLNVSNLANLYTINIDNTKIQRIDLSHQRFLRSVSVRNTGIQFLDMHGAIGTNRLNHLDMRDCKNTTPQSLNFTFKAMPSHTGNSYRTNVFLTGANYEHANTGMLDDDADNSYKLDVHGDATASMDSISITMQSSENGGSYTLSQIPDDGYFATYEPIKGKVLPGFPIKIDATAPTGAKFVGVEVNGKLIADSIFVVSEAAVVKPVFSVSGDDDYIKLTVPAGIDQQYFLSVSGEEKDVSIDWGDGELVKVKVKSTPTTIEGQTSGQTVTIYGAVTGADFSSYPGVGVDNKITAVDLSHNVHLRSLSTYMNSITSIDVSKLTDLESLDCSYSDLSSLDVSKNSKLINLRAYGNQVDNIDVTGAVDLAYLDVKNNWLESLDLSHNKKLVYLNISSNEIETVDVREMTELVELYVSKNKITALDVSKNPALRTLQLSNNSVTTLDVKSNPQLVTLIVDGNRLEGLDLTGHERLTYLNVGGNGWDACTLNDLYYSLSRYPTLQSGKTPRGNTLFVRGEKDGEYNDAEHAESSIAKLKGWTIDYEGDGTGCNMAYITIQKPDYGTLKVFTADGVEVLTGTKVAKNTELTIKAIPASGYKLETLILNDEDVDSPNFKVTSSVTIGGIFTVSDQIDTLSNDALSVSGGKNCLSFTTASPIHLNIYTLNGKLRYSGMVRGSKTVSLPSGVYIIKTKGYSKVVAVE